MLCTNIEINPSDVERVYKALESEWSDVLCCSVSKFMARTVPLIFRDTEGNLCVVQHGEPGSIAFFDSLHSLKEYVMSHSNCKSDEQIRLYSCYSASFSKKELEAENFIVQTPSYFPIAFGFKEEGGKFYVEIGEIISYRDVEELCNLMVKIAGLSWTDAYKSVCAVYGGTSPFDPGALWRNPEEPTRLLTTEEAGICRIPEDRF
jgi:hypothetical protein